MINKPKIKLQFIIQGASRYLRSTFLPEILIKRAVFSLTFCFCALYFLPLVLVPYAQGETKKSFDRELWKGEMKQTSPMSWNGPFELFLRYDSEATPPQPLDGLTIWPTLGQAKIKVRGTWKNDGLFEFEETECVSGECSKVVVGGKYKASVDAKREVITGDAVGPMGLKGQFSARRFRLEEK